MYIYLYYNIYIYIIYVNEQSIFCSILMIFSNKHEREGFNRSEKKINVKKEGYQRFRSSSLKGNI